MSSIINTSTLLYLRRNSFISSAFFDARNASIRSLVNLSLDVYMHLSVGSLFLRKFPIACIR